MGDFRRSCFYAPAACFQTLEEREWFAEAFEATVAETTSAEEQKAIAGDLLRSQVWDHFLALKFPSVKRYGAEGAESMMAFFREVFRRLSIGKAAPKMPFFLARSTNLKLESGSLRLRSH